MPKIHVRPCHLGNAGPPGDFVEHAKQVEAVIKRHFRGIALTVVVEYDRVTPNVNIVLDGPDVTDSRTWGRLAAALYDLAKEPTRTTAHDAIVLLTPRERETARRAGSSE